MEVDESRNSVETDSEDSSDDENSVSRLKISND